ncbi:hypothetical protein FSP39_005831 [Pinctada imbricata]|uniref:Transporter n=1 Tax=Pinctada imbricata TaxID=66713 RepID=A0AA88XYF7_PINIB|nr:hypothetical protein FSP39_005831 [Pinctada imbricata]
MDSEGHDSLSTKPTSNERAVWDRKIEYLLSILGYCVGLGNLYRFPYLVAKHGGGAFLVPYAIFLFLCGLPLFMLEVSIGQFSGKSPVVVWSISPFFRGLGFLMMCVSGLVSWYYNTIMAWTIYFFVHSFFPSIPWSSCDNWWNTDICITRRGLLKGLNETAVNINNTFQTTTLGVVIANSSKYSTAAYEFWEYNVLRRSAGIDYMGSVQWHLVAVMAGAWLLTCLCLVKGVHSVGKVVYVTVTLPYILFTVLLIRGLTLEGSLDGIIHYVKPSFHDMFKFGAWRDAATQVFFSLGPMWGGIITMSSYNKFHNKCIRDAIYGTIADGLTSFYAGFVIFALLGVIVHDSGLTMDDIPISGPELLFIVYPEILASMPLPNVWSVLFFLMLLTVGIDSQFGMLETVSSGLIDAFPERLGKRRVLTTTVLCLGFFVLSMPYTTNGGYYLLQLMDWYASAFCVMLGAFLECIVVAWVYGAERFSRDIELMTGAGVGMIVRFAWCIITPLIMIYIYKYKYPDAKLIWSEILPRIKWRYSTIDKAMEKTRKRLNRQGRNVFLHNGGVIHHPQFSSDLSSMLTQDGVHLSSKGNTKFCHNLSEALIGFLSYNMCNKLEVRHSDTYKWLVVD